MSVLTILLLMLSVANLGFVVIALVGYDGQRHELDRPTPKRANLYGILAVVLVSVDQLSYLILVIAWQQHWIRFYPGNRVQTGAIGLGLFLSITALILASVATGIKRLAAIVVAVTTALFWLLSAIASASV